MIIGLGALGSHIADGLLRRGESLILIDPDHVEEENIPFTTYMREDIGRAKVRVFEQKYARHASPRAEQIITRQARFESLAEEDRNSLVRKAKSIIITTDTRESRRTILTLLPAERDVYAVSIGLESGDIIRARASQLARLLAGKRGFSCETRRLHPALPRLTASLFLATWDALHHGEALRITRNPLSLTRYTLLGEKREAEKPSESPESNS